MPFIFYGFLLATLAADLATKMMAASSLELGAPVTVIPYLFSWNLVHNDGVAFGMGLPGKNLITVLLILGLFAWWRTVEIRKKRWWVDAAFGLMLGGAVGNGFERLAYGSVTDFIDLKLFVCNVGDIALTAGVVLLAGYEWAAAKWAWLFPAKTAPEPVAQAPTEGATEGETPTETAPAEEKPAGDLGG